MLHSSYNHGITDICIFLVSELHGAADVPCLDAKKMSS